MSEWIISEFDLDPNDPRGKTVNNSMFSYFNPILSIPSRLSPAECDNVWLHLENLPWGSRDGSALLVPCFFAGGVVGVPNLSERSIDHNYQRLQDDLDFSSQGIVVSATRVPPHFFGRSKFRYSVSCRSPPMRSILSRAREAQGLRQLDFLQTKQDGFHIFSASAKG